MSKILMVLGFNIAVAVALYFFGASLTTCWFTFLFFCLFAGGNELSDRLNDLERRLSEPRADLGEAEKDLELGEITNRLVAFERRFEEHESTIAWHLECGRRLQQIADGIRELRTSAATASFSSEGESEKEQSRSVTVYLLGSIQKEMEDFRLPLFDGKNLCGLSMRLEDIQRIVQEATLASPAMSIEQIDRETRSILKELDGIQQWCKSIEDMDAAKE